MRRLGEILLERGAIAIAELHTGLEACHYSGGRLGTQLLKFGFVDEHALLEALSEQLDVPFVSGTVLRRAPDALRRLIPLHVARRIQAVVFEKKEGSIGVAMTTPRNPAAIEEVVSYLGLDITPHVATEVGILTALAEVKEEATETVPIPKVPEIGFVGAKDQWDRLWSPPKLRSTDLLQTGKKNNGDSAQLASTFPELAPVPESGRPVAVGPLEKHVYRLLLRDVKHRDEVGELLLRRATAILDRCYLLAVHSGKVAGWLAKGAGVVLDDVQSFAMSQDTPSILSDVDGMDGFWGPVPPNEANSALKKILGDPETIDLGVFPVLVKNRIVAYLIGDKTGTRLPAEDRKALADAAEKASLAFEVLILKKKIVS